MSREEEGGGGGISEHTRISELRVELDGVSVGEECGCCCCLSGCCGIGCVVCARRSTGGVREKAGELTSGASRGVLLCTSGTDQKGVRGGRRRKYPGQGRDDTSSGGAIEKAREGGDGASANGRRCKGPAHAWMGRSRWITLHRVPLALLPAVMVAECARSVGGVTDDRIPVGTGGGVCAQPPAPLGDGDESGVPPLMDAMRWSAVARAG